MVSALRRYFATAKDYTTKLNGRLYAAASPKAVLKGIHTQKNTNGRVPHLDLVLEENRLQPYIHDGVVTVIYRKKENHFHIFVKNHKRLRSNKIVGGWKNGASWKGDILVMRKGLVHEFVSLRGGDAALADFAVKRFVRKVKQKSHFYIPKNLVFRKK